MQIKSHTYRSYGPLRSQRNTADENEGIIECQVFVQDLWQQCWSDFMSACARVRALRKATLHLYGQESRCWSFSSATEVHRVVEDPFRKGVTTEMNSSKVFQKNPHVLVNSKCCELKPTQTLGMRVDRERCNCQKKHPCKQYRNMHSITRHVSKIFG